MYVIIPYYYTLVCKYLELRWQNKIDRSAIYFNYNFLFAFIHTATAPIALLNRSDVDVAINLCVDYRWFCKIDIRLN